MKTVRNLVFIVILLQYPFLSLCQFSKQQAVDLVLGQVLLSDTGHIDVYCSYGIIEDTSKIILADGQTLLPIYHNNWVFFSDDHPRANWYHPCRYIFVNSITGDFQIFENSAYPFDLQINYQPLLVTYPIPADCWYSGLTPPSGHPRTLPAATNSHLHAVLINGIDRSAPYGIGSYTCNFDYDIAVMYNALEEMGYSTLEHSSQNPPQRNIIVLYDNGALNNAGKTVFHNDWDGYGCNPDSIPCTYNEVYGAATHSKIIEIFDSLSDGGVWALRPEDQLLVYITGNGGIFQGKKAFECYHDTNTSPVWFTAM